MPLGSRRAARTCLGYRARPGIRAITYGWSELTAGSATAATSFIAAPRRELYDNQTDSRGSLPRRGGRRIRGWPDACGACPRRHDGRNWPSRRRRKKARDRSEPEVEERLRSLGYVGGDGQPRRRGWGPTGFVATRRNKIGPLQPAQARRARLPSPANSTTGISREVREVPSRPTPRSIEAHTMLGKHGRQGTSASRGDRLRTRKALAIDPGARRCGVGSLALAYQDAREKLDEAAGRLRGGCRAS